MPLSRIQQRKPATLASGLSDGREGGARMSTHRNRRYRRRPVEAYQRRQDWRESSEAFWWGFVFSFWGLIVVAITKDDYPEGTNPLANAIMGLLAVWVVFGFVMILFLLLVGL